LFAPSRAATLSVMTNRQRWTLLATIIGSGAVFLDSSVVNSALARIGHDPTLPASLFGVLEGQTYVVSGYFAVLAALLILAGGLSDYYGRRRVYSLGLIGFTAASALCGVAPSLEWLVVFRLLQGAAGAFLVPGALALITSTFDGASRGRAFGIWAAATSALNVLGPLVGGVTVDTVGWRFAFVLNVPLLIFALWITRRYIEESRDSGMTARFDWLGAVVAALAVGGLAFGMIRAQAQAWHDPLAWVSIAIGAVSLIAFPFLMARRPNPLVPLGLFRSRTFAAINLTTFFIYGGLYVTFAYQPLVLQSVLGYTALGSSAVGLPIGIMLSIFSTRIGTIAGRRGARPFMTIGPLLMALGLLWLARLPVDSTAWKASIESPGTLIPPLSVLVDVLPAMLLFGAGISCVVAPLTTTLMSSVPSRVAGVASAINNAISRVGQPLIAPFIFIALSATFYSVLGGLVPGVDTNDPTVRAVFQPLNLPSGVPAEQIAAARQASMDAFHLSMFVAAGLLGVGALISRFGLKPGVADPTDADEPIVAAAAA
jgi:EmrB/QacA subfamily drug resistance transporter